MPLMREIASAPGLTLLALPSLQASYIYPPQIDGESQKPAYSHL